MIADIFSKYFKLEIIKKIDGVSGYTARFFLMISSLKDEVKMLAIMVSD